MQKTIDKIAQLWQDVPEGYKEDFDYIISLLANKDRYKETDEIFMRIVLENGKFRPIIFMRVPKSEMGL